MQYYRRIRKEGRGASGVPGLCLSGYTCNDLFQQEVLLEQVREELKNLVEFTKERKCWFCRPSLGT